MIPIRLLLSLSFLLEAGMVVSTVIGVVGGGSKTGLVERLKAEPRIFLNERRRKERFLPVD